MLVSSADGAVDGAHAFDFIEGSWRVSHRRLSRRMVGDTQWAIFGGSMRARLILGGLGNFDENVIDLPGGRYQACTLRLYDRTLGQWSIYWIDGRDPKLDIPMRGGFTDGVGVFFGDDIFDGRPIRVRFLWSAITPNSARWEQAFSGDGEQSWETNWIMNFEKP